MMLNSIGTGANGTIILNTNGTGGYNIGANSALLNTNGVIVPAGAFTVKGITFLNELRVLKISENSLIRIPGTISGIKESYGYNETLSGEENIIYITSSGYKYTLPTENDFTNHGYSLKGKTIYLIGDETNTFSVEAQGTDKIRQANNGALVTTVPLRSYGMYVNDGGGKWIEVSYR
ncbi:MAG: hypothetical protein EOP47_28215 [Sphingobacteriaceae bacterium]|nr:MAG: hypothetical protein EOP47_28215 [Sphingobacteriaceae bacterium]